MSENKQNEFLQFRLLKGLSQKAMADLLFVSQSMISQVESGLVKPSGNLLGAYRVIGFKCLDKREWYMNKISSDLDKLEIECLSAIEGVTNLLVKQRTNP